jgi:tRNA1(Val) A37 N6-methylase TrmN6
MAQRYVKRLETEYVRPLLRKLRPSRRVRFGKISIRYKAELDGGGTTFGQDFISFFKAREMPRQRRLFEWCCGPGFIGFSMLANGTCETLCLADINPSAVASCRNTVKINKIEDLVTVYESNNLRGIPHTEKWSLVVSNPPHFIDQYEGEIRAHDPDWQIHREFFQTVGDFLEPGGVIVLQENNAGSTVESFRQMIEDANLQIVSVDGASPQLTPESRFYYVGIMRKGEQPPSWLEAQVERVTDDAGESGWRLVPSAPR